MLWQVALWGFFVPVLIGLLPTAALGQVIELERTPQLRPNQQLQPERTIQPPPRSQTAPPLQQAPAGRAAVAPVVPPGSFALTCRAGKFRSLAVEHFANGEFRSVLGFRPANRPASQGIDPGHCAWADRAFRPGEAENICHTLSGLVIVQTSHAVDSNFNPPDILLLVNITAPQAPYLEDLNDATAQFTLFVQSDGQNCMNVTGVP